jgi:hypothetical protein
MDVVDGTLELAISTTSEIVIRNASEWRHDILRIGASTASRSSRE